MPRADGGLRSCPNSVPATFSSVPAAKNLAPAFRSFRETSISFEIVIEGSSVTCGPVLGCHSALNSSRFLPSEEERESVCDKQILSQLLSLCSCHQGAPVFPQVMSTSRSFYHPSSFDV